MKELFDTLYGLGTLVFFVLAMIVVIAVVMFAIASVGASTGEPDGCVTSGLNDWNC
jgi:hypothetical protein